jgi:hypothetical protein
VREEAKLRQQSAGDAQAAPIPPQWRPTNAAPTVKNSGQKIFVAVLLWPLKLLRRIVIAVPQLAILGVLIGAIALYDAATPKRPPPSGPKPYKAEAPAQPKPAAETNLNTEVSDCRIVSNYATKSGHGARIYSYMKDGAKHYTSRKPLGCNVASSSDYAAEDIDTAAHASSAAAPNGSPWPTKAAYIPGYPIPESVTSSDRCDSTFGQPRLDGQRRGFRTDLADYCRFGGRARCAEPGHRCVLAPIA